MLKADGAFLIISYSSDVAIVGDRCTSDVLKGISTQTNRTTLLSLSDEPAKEFLVNVHLCPSAGIQSSKNFTIMYGFEGTE